MGNASLFLLPGLGADKDLFYPQAEHFKNELAVIEASDDASLWSQRPCMTAAAELILTDLISRLPEGGEYVLGGMSFGGSLAIEMTRLIVQDKRCPPPKAIVLIASNRTADSISRGFRINRAVGSLLPHWAIRRTLSGLSGIFVRRESLGDEDTNRLREMAGRADIEQLLWGASAIAKWNLADDDIASWNIPIHQIHGQHDWVIPIVERHTSHRVENGRHLITWTHRDEINDRLQSILCDTPTQN